MSNWISTYRKTIIKTLIIATIILVCIVLVYGFITGKIQSFFDGFWKITAPITVGFVIAYLSNPIVSFFERRVFKWIPKFNIRRLFSILITFVLIIVLIVFILTMLVPSLISTITSFWDSYVVNYKNTIVDLSNNLNGILDNSKLFNKIGRINPDILLERINTHLPWVENLASGDFSSIFLKNNNSIKPLFNIALGFGTSLFNAIKNIVLGMFIAGYMLMTKERVKAYLRRFLNSFLTPKKVRSIVRFGKLLDRTFGGFIEGQLIDAGVVGIICYIVFSIFRLPIPLLLSCIIAVTNVIPIFGPFIGGIPAAFLVLLTAPNKLILFIVLIVIIQQIDGNLICPHILGDKINISSLATIIAIISMGGLFGIFGMVIGVPVFAVAINLINQHTMNSLRRKNLETSLDYYYVGNAEKISEKKTKPLKNYLNKHLKLKNKKEK